MTNPTAWKLMIAKKARGKSIEARHSKEDCPNRVKFLEELAARRNAKVTAIKVQHHAE